MSGGGGWWVLVEAQTGADGRTESKRTVPVDGGRDRAIARAAELARTCDMHGEGDSWGESYGRKVLRITETSWLVELAVELWSSIDNAPWTSTGHIRISVAELEYEHATPPAERPPSKGGLRGLLGRG